MTPRSRKPVLLVSGTNINDLGDKADRNLATPMENVPEEERISETPPSEKSPNSLTETFRQYLSDRNMLTGSSSSAASDSSFSSRTDDFNSDDFINEMSQSKLTESLLYCLDGNEPDCSGKKLVLKPNQFDENGQPIVFETSFQKTLRTLCYLILIQCQSDTFLWPLFKRRFLCYVHSNVYFCYFKLAMATTNLKVFEFGAFFYLCKLQQDNFFIRQ